MKPLLEVDALSVVYRGRGRHRRDKTALDGVSLSINPGETLGLVGESGSGKTTLGNCVLGLVSPTGGAMRFDGEDLAEMTTARRRGLSTQIQAVFQDPYSSFNPHRTIGQTVTETLPKDAGSRQERLERVVHMIERVGLDRSALDKFPAQFSGGQRQRIAIARALLPQPRLVVCDESVSALDLSVQAQILNLLIDLQRDDGVAYLFITHDLAVVRHISHRIAVLEHGRMVEQGSTADVIERPTEPYTIALLAASPVADPVLQGARRETRRALADAVANRVKPHEAAVAELLARLESQAVVEAANAPSTTDVTGVQSVIAQLRAGDTDDASQTVAELRYAITELSARTAAAALPPALERAIAETRAREADSLLASHSSIELAEAYTAVLDEIQAARPAAAVALLQCVNSPQRNALPDPGADEKQKVSNA